MHWIEELQSEMPTDSKLQRYDGLNGCGYYSPGAFFDKNVTVSLQNVTAQPLMMYSQRKLNEHYEYTLSSTDRTYQSPIESAFGSTVDAAVVCAERSTVGGYIGSADGGSVESAVKSAVEQALVAAVEWSQRTAECVSD